MNEYVTRTSRNRLRRTAHASTVKLIGALTTMDVKLSQEEWNLKRLRELLYNKFNN